MKVLKAILFGSTILVLIYIISENYLFNNLNADTDSEQNDIFFKGMALNSKNLNVQVNQISNYDLVRLIDSDQNATLEMLLKEQKVSPDVVNYDGLRTALLHAATELKTQSFLILAKYGADLNYRDLDGNSALINATNANKYQGEYSKPNYKIIEYLVDNGAEINVFNDYHYTPILGAIISDDLDVLKLLVESGGDVLRQDNDGANYLFYARKIEIIKYLVQQGLDINSLTRNNENVIQSYMGRHTLDKKIVQQLIELGAKYCHLDDLGKSVLDHYLDKNTPYLFEAGSERYQKYQEKLKSTDIYIFISNLYIEKCNAERINPEE